jgi:hypothetical protein
VSLLPFADNKMIIHGIHAVYVSKIWRNDDWFRDRFPREFEQRHKTIRTGVCPIVQGMILIHNET